MFLNYHKIHLRPFFLLFICNSIISSVRFKLWPPILPLCCSWPPEYLTWPTLGSPDVGDKEKMWTSQLRLMDWCGERPFGHRTLHHTFYNIFWAVLTKTVWSDGLAVLIAAFKTLWVKDCRFETYNKHIFKIKRIKKET